MDNNKEGCQDIGAANNVYSVSTNVWDGLSTASYPSSKIGGQVRPKKSEVWEVGTATNMFKNRLFLDFSYYRKMESDFIIEGGVSSATGFNSIQTNFKETRLRRIRNYHWRNTYSDQRF